MMPIDFPEANRTFAKPASMTDEECSPLRVHDTGSELISCWRLSWRQRLVVLLTGRVWLWIFGGAHPPVAIETGHPFKARGGQP